MKIVCSTNSFVIAYKPHNLPTVPLKGQESETLLSKVAQLYPEVLEIKGKNPWEGGTVHRLDTATAGLVLFARTQSFYDHIQKLQAADCFEKTYKAVTNAEKQISEKTISTFFRAFGPKGKLVKAENNIEKSDNGKLYTTKVKNIKTSGKNTTFECKITQGFRHQIRVHLAYEDCPIVGDSLYNPNYSDKKTDLQLECTGLSFELENGEVFNYTIQ